MCFWRSVLDPFSIWKETSRITLSSLILSCFFYHCWGLHLQIFIQLIHQASEELISILLFSYIQLPVPHLENLQHTKFAVRQQASGFLTASNWRIMFFRTISNIKLPSRSSQVRSTAACSPSGDQKETGPGRRHFPLAGQCHPQWRGRPEMNPHLEMLIHSQPGTLPSGVYRKYSSQKSCIPLRDQAACRAAETLHSCNKWLHHSSNPQTLRLPCSPQGVNTDGDRDNNNSFIW